MNIRSKWLSDCVLIGVYNRGDSIADEHVLRLFDQVLSQRPITGATGRFRGLGLAIVQSIMQLHGGELMVKSDAAGTCLSLPFPR